MQRKRKISHNFIDLTGKVFNSWRVIKIASDNIPGKRTAWQAECLECNRYFRVDGYNMRHGLSKRCLECGSGHGHAKQLGQVRTKRTAKESAEHYLYLHKRKDARKRGLSWELTKEQFLSLIYQNCYYSGLPPATTVNPLKYLGLSQNRTDECIITYNGLDRIDSSKGYTMDNLVPCHVFWNKSKLDHSQEHFMKMFDIMARFQGYTKGEK